MRRPSTEANGVSLCGCVRDMLMICSTRMPLITSASAIRERWQRQGTASAYG